MGWPLVVGMRKSELRGEQGWILQSLVASEGSGALGYWMHDFVAICVVLRRLAVLIRSTEFESF